MLVFEEKINRDLELTDGGSQMAKKAYDIPIDYRNTVSWSGDKTTENLPLAGSVVEKYIKDNFDHKAGYFYSDGTQGKCFVFANEDAYNR